RPRISAELRNLICAMSRANHLWGAPHIHGELLKLGFTIAQSTVARYMYRDWPPSQGWRTFLTNHVDGIAAIDLFVLPTITFRLLYCLVILRHGRRLWVSFGVTTSPTAEWISRQIIEAFPWDSAPRYLIRDRDTASDLQAAVACHGHSGQADCTPIPVAEPVCRETDRYDPTGMSRPHDRIWGGAPAPDSGSVCWVL